MAVNLTLNDFRNVLGRVNDGNVVMTESKQGIEKANYGNSFLNLFRTVRTAPNDPVENMQLRDALAKAIENSTEGKAISKADMDKIKLQLGVMEGAIDDAKFNAPLSRRELKSILEMVDTAVAHGDKLIDANIKAMDDRSIYDLNVGTGVKNAMAEAKCFDLPATTKDGIAYAKALFGQDFNGRSPAEMQKFVRNNMAVIRQQVFDKLYWESPALTVNTDPIFGDENISDQKEEYAVPVEEKAVTAAFKDVVASLMSKLAEKKPIVTKAETLVPEQPDVHIDNSRGGDELWSKTLKGGDIEFEVVKAFESLASKCSPYAKLQLRSASQALVNGIRSKFNEIFQSKQFKSQDTQVAFNKEMASLKKVLGEIQSDLNLMGPEAAEKLLEKVAEKLGSMTLRMPATFKDPTTAGPAALTALSSSVVPCSMRKAVENFVDAKFPYVQNAKKKEIVEFFMNKASTISFEQKGVFGQYQQAVLDNNPNGKERTLMEDSVFGPILSEYSAAEAAKDPQALAKMHATRNEKAFDGLLKAMPGYAKMSAAERDANLAKLKFDTLLTKLGVEKMFELGISGAEGSISIKSVKEDKTVLKDGVEVKTKEEKPDPEALKILDAELAKLDDKDFEFASQYSAKGMQKADETMVMDFKYSSIELDIEKPFESALKEGRISVSSIPANSMELFHSLLNAQLCDLKVQNGEEISPYDVIYPKFSDLRPDGGNDTKRLLLAMHSRLSERLAATGKAFPKSLTAGPENPNPADDQLSGAVSNSNEALNTASNLGFGTIRGFGTRDIARIVKLFEEMGIDLSPLDGENMNDKVNVCEKVLCLSTLAAMSGFKLDGLGDFIERVMGKPFDQVNYTDVVKVLMANNLASTGQIDDDITMQDPLNKLVKEQKTLKQFFAGEMSLSSAKLAPKDASALLEVAREFRSLPRGTAKSVTLSLKGESVELSLLKGGDLRVKFGKLPMRATFDSHALVGMLENEIATHPNDFPPETVKSALPSMADVKDGKVPLVRARELFAKVVAAKTGLLPVQFSSYTTEQLRAVALDAIDGKAVKLPTEPAQTYNSGAMLEMHANMSRTSVDELNNKVKIATTVPKDMDLRRQTAPDAKTVRNVVADLFLNQDTWAFDSSTDKGERIRMFLVGNEPEMSFILEKLESDETYLSNLPKQVRDAVVDVFRDIAKIDINELKDASSVTGGARDALAAIESKIATVADSLVNAMQEKVTALFEPKEGVQAEKPDWQKTFAELTGKEGIDVTTRQGAFTMKVLKNYFKNSALVDKRAMLSAFIRNTDENSSDAKQVAELLKGAGPLLQKMLQGLPLTSFNAETQIALKDMKSRLLPIPDEAVRAQMLELVNSSNGNILSIEVKKSLGAATVGQAFLCVIKTKDHPNAGVECVVKLLRPNVDTAIIREKAMIDKLIADDPAMKATFDGQYRKILEEFDLTLESTNVSIGMNKYEAPGGVGSVHSMELLEGTTSTMTSMIVKKAEGSTFDATIDRLRGEAEEVFESTKVTTNVNGETKTVYKAKSFGEMMTKRRLVMAKVAQLNDRRNHILDVTKAWFENALFGNGFFHGDLHGGNLMTGLGGTTFIDFGNCSTLSPVEQKAIKMMFATIMSGDSETVVANFKKLLPPDAQKAFDKAFPAKSKALDNLVAILKRGTASDIMPRLQAFVAAVQGADVRIPQSLQNFVQSYMRLSDIVADIDRTVEDLTIKARTLYCDIPKELEPVEGEPKFMAVLKPIAKAYIGSADTPYTADAVRQAAKIAEEYCNSEEGKAEIKKYAYDPAMIKTVVAEFNKTMKPIYQAIGNDKLDAPSFMPSRTIGDVSWGITHINQLEAANDTDAAKWNKEFDSIQKAFEGMAQNISEDFNASVSLRATTGGPSFSGVAAARDKSMTDVCSDVINSNSNQLQSDVIGELGVGGAFMLVGKLKTQSKLAEAMTTRMKNIGPQITKLNDDIKPEERIPPADLAKLLRATNTFFAPSPRPDADAKWASNPAKRAELLSVISYNLSRGAQALGQQHMSDFAIKCATKNFGIIDSTLVQSIAKLSEKDYSTLLLEAQQIDGQNGGHELATALAVLRDNETTQLLATVSAA